VVHSAVSDGRSHLYSRARSPSDTLELDDWKCWSRSFPAEPNHFYSPAPRSLRNRNAVLEPSCRRKYQREIGYWLIIAHNSFVNRENRVPHYQRLFQEGARQHVRQWNQTPKSKIMLYPYYAALFGGFAGSMYMMVRLTLGHKTWFGKN